MTYLIIIVIMAVVLGPVLWLMPSPKQKQQVAMRQYAMQQGLQIKICDLPQSHRQKVRNENAIKGVVYRLPLIVTRPNTMTKSYCLRVEGQDVEWLGDEFSQQQALFEAAIQACPESAVAVELSAAGVACYWQEKGGELAVDKVRSALEQFRNDITEKVVGV